MTRTKESSSTTIRCLIIQLGRLGDTLQSFMALRAAKQLYPNLEIHFVVREAVACAAQRIPWINRVLTLPTDHLLEQLFSQSATEENILSELKSWTKPMMEGPWDFVVNWTFSEPSSYLTALVPAKVKLGYTRRQDSTFSGADGWSHFIQAIVQGNIHQNIHFTDIFTTQLLTALQLHKGDPAGDGNAAVTSKGFFSLNLNNEEVKFALSGDSRQWISVQLGSSQGSQTWEPSSWARFIELVLTQNSDYGVYLLGKPEDQEQATQIMEKIPGGLPVISVVGRTSFDLWTSLISRSQWLFSGDTAAIHLASVLGVRVLNISREPTRYFETGPYGNGHYVVTSTRNTPSSIGVLPETVYTIWHYAKMDITPKRKLSENILGSSTVNVYCSRIRVPNQGGGVCYESLIKKPLTIDEWTGMVMGHLARAWYCGWLPTIGQELSRDSICSNLVQNLRQLDECSAVLLKACQQASRTGDSLKRKGQSLKSDKIMSVQNRTELQNLGKELLTLENLIDRVSKTHPSLMGFANMSRVLMHHLGGTLLADLGKETADSYRQIGDGVALFRQWIQISLDLVKPIPVHTAPVIALSAPTPPPERGLTL